MADETRLPLANVGLERPITAQPAKRAARQPLPRTRQVQVDLVADANQRYPGESVTYFLRVQVWEPLDEARLLLILPEGLRFVTARQLRGPWRVEPLARPMNRDLRLLWHMEEPTSSASVFEFEIDAQVEPVQEDMVLRASADFQGRPARGTAIHDGESLDLVVRAQGEYMRFLPALFARDELMGRLLMLFESFWKPVDQQISQLHYIFDPAVTPADMLPWLASWLDLALDPSWPEQYRRDLLRDARRLYAKRGTKVGLQEYLETYTGGDVQIIEHRADNFRLQSHGELGTGIALGMENRPHTFAVLLRLPPDQLAEEGDLERWRRVVTRIIDNEKPAHTTYTLQITPAAG